MDLSGRWRAAPADEALRRAFPAHGFDDSVWEPLAVPGHWRSNAAFAASDGPLLYRRDFEAAAPAGDRRAWLTLEGLFYDGDVWLDGAYVGATEGYFFPHTFEVTDGLRTRDDHVLAVEVGCTRPSDRAAKRNLTGVFQHWDCGDPEWNPGGIWRPVRLSETGPVRIGTLRVLCAEATPERALLSMRSVLDAAVATTVLVRVTVVGPGDGTVAELVTRHALAHGPNRIRLQVPVQRPALWWPHALGEQHLHEVTVTVLVCPDAQHGVRRRGRGREGAVTSGELATHVPSDVRVLSTGLRRVRLNRWVLTVNGERMFAKGTNQGPSRMALGEASAAELGGDMALAREAGLDLVRLHGHISRPEIYDAADHHGLLVWQDLPLQWGYARGVRRQAVRQAQEAVDLLGHHPCVALWCAHNEPLALDVGPDFADRPARLAIRYAALQALPTWNKTVLDTSIARALERADTTRPVVAHSGILPGPLSGGTDTHLYCGWYHGTERDFPRILAAMPRLARFVTEFGAQAVPESAEWMEPGRWPDLDWERIERHHALQRAPFDRFVPPGDHATFASWRAATQAYQASLIRFHIESLRRIKYRPCGGFCQFCFADGHPAVTWSVLDHARRPKAGFLALCAACAPVIVIADRPAPSYRPGAGVVLDVHVVSDLRRPLTGVRVVASMGAWTTGWEGDVPADACVKVGTVRTAAPDAPGPVVLRLTLTGAGVTASNAYTTEVA